MKASSLAGRTAVLVLCATLISVLLLSSRLSSLPGVSAQTTADKVNARLSRKQRQRQAKRRGKQPVAPLKTQRNSTLLAPPSASRNSSEEIESLEARESPEPARSGLANILRSYGERARYDQPAERAAFHRLKRLPEGDEEIPIERYASAQARMESMARFSSVENRFLDASEVGRSLTQRAGMLGNWESLGPGNIGGRTRAMLIHPQEPDTLYAAGVAGGVWKSMDAGATWNPMSDLIANIAVNSLAMDPKDPKVIYAGTGEGYFAVDNVRGAGIFKTSDGGMTWARLESTGGTPNFFYVNDLAVSPNDSKRLYAATQTGVWRSLDGGVVWTRELAQSVTGGCLDLAVRTDQPTDYLFVSCGTLTQATIFRNTDAGGAGTWNSVQTEFGMGRTALSIAPSNQSIIYAVASSYLQGPFEDALHAVFRSTSSGDPGTWTTQVSNASSNKLNAALLSSPVLALATECGFALSDDYFAQGWYDIVIAVDPVDSNRVWVGGIDLFRSDDGGLNWGVASNSYAESSFRIHPDQHVIMFHPQFNGTSNQMMYVANDGGVYRTANARAAVLSGPGAACSTAGIGVIWTSLNHNYGVTQFYHGLPAPDGKSYLGGTQDNGTLIGTDLAGSNAWREINGGDGGYVAVDPIKPSTLYAEFTGISMRKSTDGGISFGDSTFGIDDFGLFINPFFMDASDANRLWTGGAYLWRTSNGAARWEIASALTAGSGSVSAIAIAPTDASIALAGMSDGFILRTDRALTSNDLTVWTGARPRGGYVSWVAYDPLNKDIAYATYSTFGGAHVWRSIDRGASWTPIDGSGQGMLPDVPVHSIVIDPSNTARLYIGTDVGVFVSTDGGANWAVENAGFANVITESLAINIVDGVTQLFAFTHGRGVWRANINNTGCHFSLTEATRSFSSSGGSDTVSVEAKPDGCNWTSLSNAPWLVVSGSGSSNGVAHVSVQKNDSFEPRTGTATIAGRSLTIVQQGLIDDAAPVIKFIFPTTSGVFQNTTGQIDIVGTATDNHKVTDVTWMNDRGANGVAVGTDVWQIPVVSLSLGLNVFTITASDAAGNLAHASVVINSKFATVITTIAGTGTRSFSGDGGEATLATINRAVRIAYDKSGNLLIADSENHRIRRVTPKGIITTIAGTGTAGYNGDNISATTASLSFPIGIAVDAADNIYIVDNNNNRVRKITSANGLITTVAGNGSAGAGTDGILATNTTFSEPQNVSVDTAGNLFISDFGNNKIRKVTVTTGLISTVAGTGTPGFLGDDGQATEARLNGPNNVSLDGDGNLIICDSDNSRIRKVTVATGIITTIVGNGTRGFDGENVPATEASINAPVGAVVDGTGNLFFSDRSNQIIRRVDAASKKITTVAGSGLTGFNGDGFSGVLTRLNGPSGLAFSPQGSLVFADRDNSRIRRLTFPSAEDTTKPEVTITSPVPPTLSTTTSPIELRGTVTDDSPLVQVRWANDRGGSGRAIGTVNWVASSINLLSGLNRITITAYDAGGNSGQAILEVTFAPSSIIITAVGKGTPGARLDGVAAPEALLRLPSDVAVSQLGELYVADSGNHQVWKVASDGKIAAFAGDGTLGSSGDGGQASQASLNTPSGVAVDGAGNVYVSDTLNHRIRRVALDGVITTLAGTGSDSFSGDGGPAIAARLNLPLGIAVDATGNVYIADAFNNRVRKVTISNGRIETIAGNGQIGFSGDGGLAVSARLNFPTGVAVDLAGNLYIADLGNARVRKVALDGNISTVAGTGIEGFSGDNGPATLARLNQPYGLRVDALNNLYIADSANHRIRKLTPATGLITTVAGNGSVGAAGDGGAPTGAQLDLPSGIAIDSAGSIYIADYGNNRIRRVLPLDAVGSVAAVSAASFSLSTGLAPESIAAAFGANFATSTELGSTIPLPTSLAGTTVMVKDSLGHERLASLFFVSGQQINLLVPPGTADGVATLTATSGNGKVAIGSAQISRIAPSIFSANADGQGVAAALALRVKGDGSNTSEAVAVFDAAQGKFVPAVIDLGPASDQIFLVLFGTGLRFQSSVSAKIDGVDCDVLFAGAQPNFVGLDQINVRLDRGAGWTRSD